MRTFSVLAAATVAVANANTCGADGWCNFGSLDAYYNCPETPGPSCLESKIAKKDMRNEYVKLQYVAPAYKDGDADAAEFSVDANQVTQTSGMDENGAMFALTAPLNDAGGNTAAYLAVMQGITFKEFKSASVSVPAPPGSGSTTGKMDICWAGATGGVCDEKTFPKDHFKFSFAAYQVANCENDPNNCFFFLRTQLDYSTVPASAPIYFNGDEAMTADKVATGIANAISSITIGDQDFIFPTGVNVNNEQFVTTGCTVHLEETPANKIMKLAFKVAAPGAGKFIMYDPDVQYKAANQNSGAAAIGSSVALIAAAVALLM